MKQHIEWVFLLLETEENEVMFITENNEKNRPWKRKWQLSVPAGTRENGEDITETIHREFGEETGLNGITTIVEETLEKVGEIFLETEEYALKWYVYKGNIPNDAKEKTQRFNSEEVEKVEIMHPENILIQEIEKIRPGLLEALLLKYDIPSDTVHIENGIYRDINQAKAKIYQLKQLYNNAETECCS